MDQNTSGTLTLTQTGFSGNQKTPSITFTKGATSFTLEGSWIDNKITVDIGSANVTSLAGTWSITATSNQKTSSSTTFAVVASSGDPDPGPDPEPEPEPNPDPTVCAGGQETGNFGSILSPRKLETKANDAYRLNLALGLDHMLVPFDTNATACSAPAAIAGEQLDSESRPDNNCITGDKSANGADGPKLAEGLVTGVDKTAENTEGMILGRLDGRNGHTQTGCNGGVDNAVAGGISINNDVLSCFLSHGSLADLTSPPSDPDDPNLDPSVVDSPRFVWLPSVKTRANGWHPIIKFVPAFITDEDVDSPATADNGVQCQGAKCNTVPKVTAFTFNPDQLPVSERSPTVDFDPDYGRGTVRLID